MKNFALTLLLTIFLTGVIFAQNDPIGEIDTVSIGQLSVGAGEYIGVPINLWNDEDLGALTLPFSYPVDKLEFQNIDFAGGRVDYINTKPIIVDEENGAILIGVVIIFEAYIGPGEGRVCTINFRAKDDLLPGEIITIDTTFVPPAGHLLLSDASGIYNFTPAFVKGEITIAEDNRPPYFNPIPDLYVAEGDSLIIDVRASDPDGDSLLIVNPIHPYNSEFIDNGDGTGRFAWQPDFIGPMSADLSPYYFVFWTSDGDASNYIRVKVNVINVNRAPEINAPELVEAEAGDSLGINVVAYDPDFEDIDWEISGLPDGAAFDYDNPGLISWPSDFADSGQYQITLIAFDPYGLSDTATINIELFPVELFTLRIDTLTSFSGKVVEVDIFLKNKFDISEFNLLVRIDPSVLIPLGVDREGTLSENLADFDYHINDNGITGNIRITGLAYDENPIVEGEGILCRLRLQISSDLNFVGQHVSISFVSMFSADNTFVLEDGTLIDDSEINLFDGYIIIGSSGVQMLGDINLNNIAYEISDAVYFSNFFISPTLYPMNDQQILNSDINRDGYAPSIADLVLLITIITGEADRPTAKANTHMSKIVAELSRDETGTYLYFDAPVDIGGLHVRFAGEDIEQISPVNLTDMDMMNNSRSGQLNCLLISYSQEFLQIGENRAIKLSDEKDIDIYIDEINISDINGNALQVEKSDPAVLPTNFELLQNYPNPFNPVTEIRFSLTEPSWVTLNVYNILGQTVTTLTDQEYPAGLHSIIWNSTDQSGNPVASGVYLYRIDTGEHSASKKMVLLK